MRILIIILIWGLIDLYVFQSVKTVLSSHQGWFSKFVLWSYWLLDGMIVSAILYNYFTASGASRSSANFSWIAALLVISLAPKIVALPFLLVEDIVRIFQGLYFKLLPYFSKDTSAELSSFLPGRRKFVSQLAIGVAALPFIGSIYGVLRGKYQYRVHEVKITFPDLPPAFDGMTITQLSDIHAGSFDNHEAVQDGIDLANSLNSDLMVFTGDLVNNVASEMDSWKTQFAKLSAPMGVYSILGNHDYGDYQRWDSEEEKQANFEALIEVHKEIGFQLLMNETAYLEKEGDKLALLGVENWGKRGFKQKGDLNKTIAPIPADAFKVLLSHDPSHWEAETLKHEKHIHLTLSGHTHGMQFGIEIPGIKWSPIKYLYPQWAGLYRDKNKYLYVNRGFGFLGFPGRVGIMPEITKITLVKG